MQLKAQVSCLQSQVTYLLRISRAQVESTDSFAESSSQCGSGTHCLFSVTCATFVFVLFIFIDSVHASKSRINGYAHQSHWNVQVV